MDACLALQCLMHANVACNSYGFAQRLMAAPIAVGKGSAGPGLRPSALACGPGQPLLKGRPPAALAAIGRARWFNTGTALLQGDNTFYLGCGR